MTLLFNVYCLWFFPPCDFSSHVPQPRHFCRESCDYIVNGICKKESLALLNIAADKAHNDLLDINALNCSLYNSSNAGGTPECYQYHDVPGDNTRSTDCYYDNGIGYRGNINITRSGRACQRWTSQCPHRHWRIPEDVVDGQNDSNICRNPDGSAPDGPWCYTADPIVRWEYCNVSRCPPRVPEEAPTFIKGSAFNSSAIHISWDSIPSTFYKEPLLGYRIKYRHVGSWMNNEVNVTNVTEVVIVALSSLTTYEITVNGFNKNGHGPSSDVLAITTLEIGELLVDLNFQLSIEEEFNTYLLNRSSSKFAAMEENIQIYITRLFNKSSTLKLYDFRVLSFRRGSVLADIVLTFLINAHMTKTDAASRVLELLDTADIEGLNVSTITVLDKPGPPRDLKITNVQTRYFVLTWNKPRDGKYYKIQNYTMEIRTKLSKNFTVLKTVPYTRTGMMIKDLEPATKYTIRLSSNNHYGRSNVVMATQSTLPDKFIRNLMMIIVLPLSLAGLLIVIVCLKFRLTYKSKADTSMELMKRRNTYEPIMRKTVFWTRKDWRELSPSDVVLQEKIGEGAFGQVFKGLVQIDGQSKYCAVKMLKETASEREWKDLLNELQIMVTVGEHPNVISLIGACTQTEPVLVIVRLAQNGCLLTLLKKNRKNPYKNIEEKGGHFTRIDKLRIARDIANGMLHLSNKKCVHRDLAARNVLLGEDNVAMISDFGLSRDVYECGEYEKKSGGFLPIRWMALEYLEDYTCNTKTDVWSFGVVLWEIESEGKMPYSGLGGIEIVEFLKAGQRLKQPDGSPDEIYRLMTSCWNRDPTSRPSFSELLTSFEQELHNRGIYKDSLADDDTEN